MTGGVTMPTSDQALPENSKANLDRKLDHAIEETFPTSDPVSVTITKGGAIDYDRQDATPSDSRESSVADWRSTGEALLDRAKQSVRQITDSAPELARDAYHKGMGYARAARERYPGAERTYRRGSHVVRQQASENPWLTLLVGVGIGYVLTRMLDNIRSERDERLPDHARTEGGYAPHRVRDGNYY
jgi:ElaB/YqjD/DUF883 family membrane-anchored ribosome-binding protein